MAFWPQVQTTPLLAMQMGHYRPTLLMLPPNFPLLKTAREEAAPRPTKSSHTQIASWRVRPFALCRRRAIAQASTASYAQCQR